MSGTVVKNTRWWKVVPRTMPHEHEPEITVMPKSIDALLDQIRRTGGRVVHCQCELVKAEQAHEDAKQSYYEALVEIDKEVQVFRGRLT